MTSETLLTGNEVQQAINDANAIANAPTSKVSSNTFVFFAAFDGTDKRINFPGSVNDKI